MRTLLLAVSSLLLTFTVQAQDGSPMRAGTLPPPPTVQLEEPYPSAPSDKDWLRLDAGLESQANDWTTVGIVTTLLGLGGGIPLLATGLSQPEIRVDLIGGGSNAGGYLIFAAVPVLAVGLIVSFISFMVRFRTNRRRRALRPEPVPVPIAWRPSQGT